MRCTTSVFVAVVTCVLVAAGQAVKQDPVEALLEQILGEHNTKVRVFHVSVFGTRMSVR